MTVLLQILMLIFIKTHVFVCLQESDYGFDDDGGGNDSDFVGGSSSRKSRKSRGSQKHTPQAAPVQDSNSGRRYKEVQLARSVCTLFFGVHTLLVI